MTMNGKQIIGPNGRPVSNTNPAPTTSGPFQVGARPVDLTGSNIDISSLDVRAIWAGGAGIIKVDCYDLDGTTVLTGKDITVAAGTPVPFGCVTTIYSAANGTTATGLWIGR